jgi:hypothetical protein
MGQQTRKDACDSFLTIKSKMTVAIGSLNRDKRTNSTHKHRQR